MIHIGKEQLHKEKSVTFGESLDEDYEAWRNRITLHVLSFGNGNQGKHGALSK